MRLLTGKAIRCSVVCIAVLVVSAGALAADYYVDPMTGADANSGTTPAAAWKTLAKVNGTTFSPGDRILLRAGGIWVGKLNPKGSGAPGNPIVLDKYGDGPKPISDGGGSTGDAVFYLHNQQYWHVSNLELTNDAPAEGDRRGVRLSAADFGTVNHIYLKHLDIRSIRGLVHQTDIAAKRTGGIAITQQHLGESQTILETVGSKRRRCVRRGGEVEGTGLVDAQFRQAVPERRIRTV